ncbi:putative membrane protein [Propionispora sp. 2/2-37]|uniref:hypothetical protein n=1 Tax=Propionispora sp. 2/2-37 TaxID=1677858 RepID=UPI0006BB81E7|nr:hypothetical protein [Propionispora sp. 2/2-37]CUH96915.1 putative membrane protein [Propionispora sp. 2/2-37]
MIQQIWLYLFAVIIGGAIIKELFISPVILVLIDLIILFALYMLIRRYSFIDVKRSMYFFSLLTFITILVDVNLMPSIIGNIIILSILLWMIFSSGRGGGPNRPPLRHKWHK